MGGFSGVKNCSSYNGTWWNGTCYTVQDVGTDAYQTVSTHAQTYQTVSTHAQTYQTVSTHAQTLTTQNMITHPQIYQPGVPILKPTKL